MFILLLFSPQKPKKQTNKKNVFSGFAATRSHITFFPTSLQVPRAKNVRGHVAGTHPQGSGPVSPHRLDRLLLLHLEGDPLHGEGECSPTSGQAACRIHQPLIELLHQASELRGLSWIHTVPNNWFSSGWRDKAKKEVTFVSGWHVYAESCSYAPLFFDLSRSVWKTSSDTEASKWDAGEGHPQESVLTSVRQRINSSFFCRQLIRCGLRNFLIFCV